jgi:hypothetical protein
MATERQLQLLICFSNCKDAICMRFLMQLGSTSSRPTRNMGDGSWSGLWPLCWNFFARVSVVRFAFNYVVDATGLPVLVAAPAFVL